MQKGSIIETTADKINAAADGEAQYRLTGVVTKIANGKYGNIYIKDYTGEVYAYGTYDPAGNRFDAFTTPVQVGDIVTVVGPKTSYNGSPQMKNVTVEKHIPVKIVTVAEFLAAPVSKDVYYGIVGNVSKIANTTYGNFDIVDETGSVYVYGLLAGWGGPSKQFASLEIVEGDKISIIGVRAAYNGTAQVGSAFLFKKHE
jgi:RPA family protein